MEPDTPAMDLAFFFGGTQSKEETSSAIVATLLQHEPSFRSAFLRDITCVPALDAGLDWTVRVEDVRTGMRRLDVTMEAGQTFIVIENKLARGAQREGQLVEYYDASVDAWPERRVIALYLAPELSWGEGEVDLAKVAIQDAGRTPVEGPDWTQAVSWVRISQILGTQSRTISWFARSGIEQVAQAIQSAAKRVDRSWTIYEFIDAAAGRSPQAKLVVEGIRDWLNQRGIEPIFGRGATGPMYMMLPRSPGPGLPVVKVYPEGSINISYRKLAQAAPFDQVALRVALIHRLNAIPGTATIRDEYATDSESSYISSEVLARPAALAEFLAVMGWMADLLRRSGS